MIAKSKKLPPPLRGRVGVGGQIKMGAGEQQPNGKVEDPDCASLHPGYSRDGCSVQASSFDALRMRHRKSPL
jgi:hypothetical protein